MWPVSACEPEHTTVHLSLVGTKGLRSCFAGVKKSIDAGVSLEVDAGPTRLLTRKQAAEGLPGSSTERAGSLMASSLVSRCSPTDLAGVAPAAGTATQ